MRPLAATTALFFFTVMSCGVWAYSPKNPADMAPTLAPKAPTGASSEWSDHSQEVSQFNRWLFVGTINSQAGYTWNVIAVHNAESASSTKTLVVVVQDENPENMFVWEDTNGVGHGYHKEQKEFHPETEQDFWRELVQMPWTNHQLYRSLIGQHQPKDIVSWTATGWPQEVSEGSGEDRRTVVHFYDAQPGAQAGASHVTAFTTNLPGATQPWAQSDISVTLKVIGGYKAGETDDDGRTNVAKWRHLLIEKDPSIGEDMENPEQLSCPMPELSA